MEVDVCDRGSSEGRLLVGELVEVRQAGTGTWYPAKVVEVKPDFRVVEYEKGSKDGLVESIPFGRNLSEACSSDSLRGEDYSQMRPRPPPCSMCPQNWQKGLWVDAYGDAWREGVLVEEPGQFSTHVQVFFPNEGEKRQYCLHRLRISQLWNEEANRWSVKGQQESSQWLFETENKHLKPQRTYERKRKRKGILDIMKSSEGENADEKLSTMMEKKRAKQTESVGDGLVSVDRKIETTESDLQVESIQEMLESQPFELENVVADGTLQDLTNSGGAKESFDVKGPIIGDLDVESTQEMEGDDGNGLGVFQSDMDPANVESPPMRTDIPVCYMNTQSEDLLFIEEQRPTEVNSEDQNASVEAEDVSVDEDGSLVDDSMGMFPEKALCTLDNSSQSSLHSSQTCKDAACTSDDMQKNKILTIPRASRKKEKSPNDYQYTPYRRDDTLKEARRRVIKNLEDSGWKKGCRSRQRENRISMEAYYVAPDGTSYHSLTSACTAWMQQNKHVEKVVKDAMRSYQLQIIVRRKFSDRSLTEPSDMDDGDDGSRKRKLRSTKRQEALKKSKKNENGVQDKFKKGRPRTECRLEALLSTPARGKQDGGTEKGVKRTTIFSWLIDLGIVTENETVSYLNKDTHVTSKGLVTRDGVLCKCCNDVFTLTNFQIHAGNKVHRTAAQIILEDGRSILDCQRQALKKLEDARSEEPAGEPVIMDESDECCGLCAEGGELICCDHCPATFHLHCVLLKCLPEGDWFCPKCRCPVCGASQFDGRDAHFCNQCERSYHVECVNDGGIPHEGSWFCSQKCYKIFCGLRTLIGISNPMDGGFTWTLLRSAEHDYDVQHQADTESIAEHSSKLALALAVMKECFSPMIDPRRKIDIIAHILKNRSSDLKRLDFRGFYTLLLENKDELISVASIRVHGADIAEMPLIGTRLQYRRQGMCRRLMDVIEQVLRTLEVDTLILPAVPELQETWIGAFGFQNVTSFQSVRLLELNVVGFPGTKVLHKPLTWLNLCRRIAPPLAEKPWSPGSLLNMGIDAQPQKKPKQQKASVAAVAEDVSKDNQYAQMQEVVIKTEKDEVPAPKEDSTEDSKIFVAKTRSNRLVKASQRVAEALKTLSTHKKFYGVESDTALQSEDSLDLDNTSELSFLKLGSSQLVMDNGKPVPAVSTSSIKELLELGTSSKASSSNEIREPQETTSGMASKEIVELKGASAVVGIFDSRPEHVVQSKSKPFSSMLKKCGHCGTTETPMWRKGPVNSASLCNACGIRFRKRLFCS